jgi:hypothetical protein
MLVEKKFSDFQKIIFYLLIKGTGEKIRKKLTNVIKKRFKKFWFCFGTHPLALS